MEGAKVSTAWTYRKIVHFHRKVKDISVNIWSIKETIQIPKSQDSGPRHVRQMSISGYDTPSHLSPEGLSKREACPNTKRYGHDAKCVRETSTFLDMNRVLRHQSVNQNLATWGRRRSRRNFGIGYKRSQVTSYGPLIQPPPSSLVCHPKT